MAGHKRVVFTEDAPAPIGPYSQAVMHGDLLFVSGQLGVSMDDGALDERVEIQTRHALEHLRTIVEEAGADLSDVLKTTCFLADMGDFAAFNAVYAEFFVGTPPARSCIAVKTLPRNALVEIEAIVSLS